LRETLLARRVACGVAAEPARSLPPEARQRIGTGLCAIPLLPLPVERQSASLQKVRPAAEERGFPLQSYCVTSPFPGAS